MDVTVYGRFVDAELFRCMGHKSRQYISGTLRFLYRISAVDINLAPDQSI